MNVFFDVQGTLISSGVPRPHTREALREIELLGHHIYLWSSGGNAYAAQAAKLLGLGNIPCGFFSKATPPPVNIDFVVDDQPYLVERYGGHLITPFDGDPEDRELWKVVSKLVGR